MQFSFGDLYKDDLLESKVLVVMGNYALFNNIAIDRVKDKVRDECKASMLKFMGVLTEEEKNMNLKDTGNIVDFDKFIEYSKVPPFLGKWYCNVDYKMMTKKQKDKLDEYLQYPNKYGVLTIESNDFRDFKDFTRNRLFKQNNGVNFIKLSFPNRGVLKNLIKDRCGHIKIADKAMDLFIMRMSDNYDEYDYMLSTVVNSGYKEIGFDEMKEILAGIENYAIDDFMDAILKPPTEPGKSKRRLYTMMRVMVDDAGGMKIINTLKRNIDRLIEIRTYINQGFIPGRIKYSIKEFKERLPEESPLKNTSDFILKKHIATALDCSLRDLMFIKLILQSNTGFSDEACEMTLIKIIHRAVVGYDRLLSDIGIQDDMDRLLYRLNGVLIESKVREIEDIRQANREKAKAKEMEYRALESENKTVVFEGGLDITQPLDELVNYEVIKDEPVLEDKRVVNETNNDPNSIFGRTYQLDAKTLEFLDNIGDE